MPRVSRREQLESMYAALEAHFGFTGWWPADSPFEVAVGAILTQNTAWRNVERAIENLKRARLLAPSAILNCENGNLEEALRPSGYFRVKARRLRSFCVFLIDSFDGDPCAMARLPLAELRPRLLDVNGIGPETADDILLYACEKPVFVVDAYTRRIFSRHGLCPPDAQYEPLRALFERHLAADPGLFKEYHALIVYTGKEFCRRVPRCETCPLRPWLRRGQPLP